MGRIYIIYWSHSGNTQAMAEAIGKGITNAGKEKAIMSVENAELEDIMNANCFALGCPAMGAETLEETLVEPFVSRIEGFVSGKTIALFGSYDWGNGQWMRDWEDRMTRSGATILNGEGLICQGQPDKDIILKCEEIGKQLVTA